jgi:hypothetical protein
MDRRDGRAAEHQLLVHLEARTWGQLREVARADGSTLADVIRRALIAHLTSKGFDVTQNVQ